MKLNCRHISIIDEEFGCTIMFSPKKEENSWENEVPIAELITNLSPYILLQRTYAEDELDEDYCYIESNNADTSGELKDFTIEMYRSRILVNCKNELYDISININDDEFNNLKIALKKIANEEEQFKIYL